MTAHAAITAQVDVLVGMAEPLSDHEIVAVIRKLTERLTYSYGADKIAYGCDLVDDDIADEQRVVEQGLPAVHMIETRAVSLNADVWGL